MLSSGASSSTPAAYAGQTLPTHEELEKLFAGMDGVSLGAIFAFRRASDGSFSFPFVSPIFEQAYGLTRQDLARDASPVLRSIAPDDLPRVLDSIAESSEKLTEWRCEFRVNTPAKGPMWLEGRSVPRREGDGGTLWYGYASGVSARKQAELAVQQSEQKFAAYVENAPIAIMVVEGDGRIVECNPAVLQMLGYDRAEMDDRSVFDLHTAEDRDEVRARLQRLAHHGRLDGEFRWVRRDGRVIWVQLRAVALDAGRSIGFCQDITERKSAEMELIRSRQLLEAFVEHAPVGIAMFNRELRYVRSSRRWREVFRASEQSLAGRRHYDDPGEMNERWVDAHQRGLAGETVKGEDEWVRPDGKHVRHRWEVHPWGDAGVDTGGIIVFFEDVTAARAMEAELRHAHKMEALGQLAGGVAHDFNNLLQIIYGYTEMVQHQLADDPRASQYTGEVLRATRRASSLTRQLLAFSRRQVFAPSVVDLNAVITSTTKMLKRLLGEHIAFEMSLDEAPCRVEADADQLSQVLINLCVNARDAMPHGGSLTVSTSNCRVGELGLAGHLHVEPGEYVVMTVGDTGTGMDPEVMQHIFEPFFTTKGTGRGTGLGLSTVYGIVTQSNGHVWADSSPGLGTRFTLCLPRTHKAYTEVSLKGTKPLPGDNQTLLVVEDDADVRQAVAAYLPSLGYAVLAAHPADAMQLASQHAAVLDLLITDVVMPGISGPDLAANVRALKPKLPILFMSGNIDDAVTRHGVLDATAPFLQKPFTLSELASAIRKALSRN